MLVKRWVKRAREGFVAYIVIIPITYYVNACSWELPARSHYILPICIPSCLACTTLQLLYSSICTLPLRCCRICWRRTFVTIPFLHSSAEPSSAKLGVQVCSIVAGQALLCQPASDHVCSPVVLIQTFSLRRTWCHTLLYSIKILEIWGFCRSHWHIVFCYWGFQLILRKSKHVRWARSRARHTAFFIVPMTRAIILTTTS